MRLYVADKEALTLLRFCCKARKKAIEHERSVGGNTRRSRVLVSHYLLSA